MRTPLLLALTVGLISSAQAEDFEPFFGDAPAMGQSGQDEQQGLGEVEDPEAPPEYAAIVDAARASALVGFGARARLERAALATWSDEAVACDGDVLCEDAVLAAEDVDLAAEALHQAAESGEAAELAGAALDLAQEARTSYDLWLRLGQQVDSTPVCEARRESGAMLNSALTLLDTVCLDSELPECVVASRGLSRVQPGMCAEGPVGQGLFEVR